MRYVARNNLLKRFCFLSLNRLCLDNRCCRYASYVVVPESKFVVKLPDSIPLDMACMLPCSAVTAYNAVSKALPVVEHATNYEGINFLLAFIASLAYRSMEDCKFYQLNCSKRFL